MTIHHHESTKIFHLQNSAISYILIILPNGEIGNLYFGKRIEDKDDFSYLMRLDSYPVSPVTSEEERSFSLSFIRREYPNYGTSDFRYPAFSILQENGSSISNFRYKSHRIIEGKPFLPGLPSTYTESPEEALTLEIDLFDGVSQTDLLLRSTIFRDYAAIARSAQFTQKGSGIIRLQEAMSGALDLPDSDFEMVHLAGSWGRERHVKTRPLVQGVQSIHSIRGASSAEHNPFMALKSYAADEFQGDVYGFSLVYSGNFLAQAEVDSHNTTRVIMGIHPQGFSWKLGSGESFCTPEMVMVYSDQGLNGMSQIYHRLYRTRLASGYWRDRNRPILVNNWEATEMDFTEEEILSMASTAQKLGAELFTLDDGWFGDRDNDKAGLGDWYVKNFAKIPSGIEGLAEKIEAMGLSFGLWIEPEMINKDSELYRTHPDWIIATPDRFHSPSRNQHVLDFSRKEVVDYIFQILDAILSCGKISYIKWDMNRYITECFSPSLQADEQGKVFHSYILGVYSLYERLTSAYPRILIESCASGGARFDPGIFHYAPQGWISDDTDAVERLKIQYGTSYVYPLSSMGAHVTAVPNQQVGRITPLETRANTAFFGVFGYELDLRKLSSKELEIVKTQIAFYKAHREIIRTGIFYRLRNPFKESCAAWIVIAEDGSNALAGYYQVLDEPNPADIRLRLRGLDLKAKYHVSIKDQEFSGSELCHFGLMVDPKEAAVKRRDFFSVIYCLQRI